MSARPARSQAARYVVVRSGYIGYEGRLGFLDQEVSIVEAEDAASAGKACLSAPSRIALAVSRVEVYELGPLLVTWARNDLPARVSDSISFGMIEA